MNILSIKRKNYSWNFNEDKRNLDNSKYLMETTVNTTNKVSEYKDEKRLKSTIHFQMLIKQEEKKIAEYIDNYQVIISDDEFKDYPNEKEINNIKYDEKILSIVEPYIRINLDKTLDDAGFPNNILAYRFWKDAELVSENEEH
ncbi:hypothetical protein [Staphylococcus hominis]|uniref:hypothetical protein n=1 Tax=Staphylococcus hominis TaxID=1290 RepID=UPI003458767D